MFAISTSKRVLVLGRGASGRAAAEELARRGHPVDFAEDYALVIASPGVPVKSELQLGCEELKRRGWKLLAVTGSKGKSSVVKLCAEALGGVPCGNYGKPVCELLGSDVADARAKWAVVEVSSFQLETTELASDTFVAAAILNFQDDHLDRHGSREIYHRLKRKLLSFACTSIEPFSEETSDVRLLAGSYFDNEVLRLNGLSAIALLRAAGLDDAEITTAFAAFKPLPHRFEAVAELSGVRYVDDSKATSLAALEAGVRMAGGGVRLIAGGLPKGDDPASASTTLTGYVKKVYLIGQSAESFARAWSASVDCEICGTLDRAVARAMCEAAKGETVLLSPGAASYDQFTDFGERGETFARLVNKGKKE